MDVCALTGKHGKFIRSHLYPQAFYDFPEDQAPFKMIGGRNNRPRTNWTGLYDERLVIQDGEDLLSKLDNAAAKMLLPRASAQQFFESADELQMSGQGDKVAFAIFNKWDVETLLVFFCSILWRFGASKRPEASGTELGPYLPLLQEAILRNKAPDSASVGVSLLRIVDSEGSFAFTPARYEAEGVNMWQLVFGNFQVNIRCDRRKPPFPYSKLEMQANKPAAIMAYEFTRSRSYENVARMVQSSTRAHGWPWGNAWPR